MSANEPKRQLTGSADCKLRRELHRFEYLVREQAYRRAGQRAQPNEDIHITQEDIEFATQTVYSSQQRMTGKVRAIKQACASIGGVLIGLGIPILYTVQLSPGTMRILCCFFVIGAVLVVVSSFLEYLSSDAWELRGSCTS